MITNYDYAKNLKQLIMLASLCLGELVSMFVKVMKAIKA